jgi:peptidoglycan/xylan/chitin deacetylase (PgdA/CDA1 family)
MKRWSCIILLLFFWLPPAFGKPKDVSIPILLYHRFGPSASDSMTTPTSFFESHLKYFSDNGYSAIPLRALVDYHLGRRNPPPPRSLVITVDDGHQSVYTDMLPLLKKYHCQATLFLYPSAISNASYALTWNQLREMKETGVFDFQSHTYWHPNFKQEKKRLLPDQYETFVRMQFTKSKEKLEKEFHTRVDMLAWPFGIYDELLMKKAAEAGYVAAFAMMRQHATAGDDLMALPRYLLTNSNSDAIKQILSNGSRCEKNR